MRGNGQSGNGELGTFSEEIEITGGQLVDWVAHLRRDGSVRQIRVKAPGGQILLDASAGGGDDGLGKVWIGMLGSLAALVARVRVEIVRLGERPMEDDIAALWEGDGDDRAGV